MIRDLSSWKKCKVTCELVDRFPEYGELFD